MKRKKTIAVSALLAIALAAAGWYYFSSSAYDELVEQEIGPSKHLASDKSRMWRLVRIRTNDQTGKVTYLVSPVSAINAASRVMESEKTTLIGLTPKEVLLRLNHDDGHRRGSYNAPFFPLKKDEKAMILRFDCGSFGWQFDLLLGEDGKVREVRRRWIH